MKHKRFHITHQVYNCFILKYEGKKLLHSLQFYSLEYLPQILLIFLSATKTTGLSQILSIQHPTTTLRLKGTTHGSSIEE